LQYNFSEEDGASMANADNSKRAKSHGAIRPLMLRLDDETIICLSQAAELRGISVSEYVRTVAVAQARKDVRAAQEQMIALAPDEQLALWNALDQAPVLTDPQRQVGAIMRGEA
jgi:uncharacterized protein (DUF1778 family)